MDPTVVSYFTPIENLELPTRLYNLLRHYGITKVGDITSRSKEEFRSTKRFGPKMMLAIHNYILYPYRIEYENRPNRPPLAVNMEALMTVSKDVKFRLVQNGIVAQVSVNKQLVSEYVYSFGDLKEPHIKECLGGFLMDMIAAEIELDAKE